MIGCLMAYDTAGNVVATLDWLVQGDGEGAPIGLVDFATHEAAGGDHTAVWVVDTHDPTNPVKGSKVWPEWLGSAAHDFSVELAGSPGRKHIAALVHKTSGHRRERTAIEAAISGRIEAAEGKPADIRDLVGGPDRPLALDAEGRTAPRVPHARPNLPLVMKR